MTKQREELADMIISAMGSGVPLWKQGWVGGCTRQHNPFSGTRYRGCNALRLAHCKCKESYSSNCWATFHQIKEKGLKFVKPAKGKGVSIEYFSFHKVADADEDMELLSSEKKAQRSYAVAKSFVVFNLSLTDYVEEEDRITNAGFSLLETGERLLATSFVPIIEENGDGCYYSVTKDYIHLAERRTFISAEAFYSTAAHEMIHSSGAAGRLNRPLKSSFATRDYAKEELVAELGAIFLCDAIGIHYEEDSEEITNHAAYLADWLDRLCDEKQYFFDAMKLANEAADIFVERYHAIQLPLPLSIMEPNIKAEPASGSICTA